MTKILITGINECIGQRAAELAQARGWEVRGLQVSDITDSQKLEKACLGIDVVLHAAEITKEGGKLKDFQKINVDGTVNVARAAQKAGVKTLIHMSSVLVYGFDYSNHITEDGKLGADNNPYCQTKIEAELAVLKYNQPPQLGVVIIRAGDVYGPGIIPWVVRPVSMMRQNTFACVNDGKGVMNNVYIDNLVEAIFLAIEKQPYGEIFNITDGNETSWKEYFTRLAAIVDLPPPFSLPKDEIKLFLQLRHQAQKLFRKEADILPESVDFMSRPYAYSIAKAKNLLNYQPKIDINEGMQLTKQWLQQQ